MTKLTHLDAQGAARMLDVGAKPASERRALAGAHIAMKPETLALIVSGGAPKGDVLAAARIAGIMAAKRTADLIPLCHPLALTKVEIRFTPNAGTGTLGIEAEAAVIGPTGVEMEALTAVTVAALTVYDMAKAADRSMTIGGIRLLEKDGGRSGPYRASPAQARAPRPARSVPQRPSPRALFSEAAPLPPPGPDARREAFRSFMLTHRLRAQAWAKDAGIPASALYSYLHGRSRSLTDEQAEKLARAARCSVKDMFGG
jgi:cyclic pyranopterin phosphate synthase